MIDDQSLETVMSLRVSEHRRFLHIFLLNLNVPE